MRDHVYICDPMPIADPVGYVIFRRFYLNGRWDDEWVARERLLDFDGAVDEVGEALTDGPGQILDPRSMVRVYAIATGCDVTDEVMVQVAAVTIARSLECDYPFGDWFDRYRPRVTPAQVAAIKAVDAERAAKQTLAEAA